MVKAIFNMKKKNIKKMVIFGTLFKSKMGGVKDLLVILDKEKEVKEIDKEYQKRKILGPWGLKKLAKLYQGTSLVQLKEVSLNYIQKNLLKGLKDMIIALKSRNIIVGVISANPQFMLDALKEVLPLDFALGTQFEFKEGVATGKIQKEVNRYTKAVILKEKRKEYGVTVKNTIIIGELFPSHLPMTKEAGTYIAFNPVKETIRDIARMIVMDKNLNKTIF